MSKRTINVEVDAIEHAAVLLGAALLLSVLVASCAYYETTVRKTRLDAATVGLEYDSWHERWVPARHSREETGDD